MYSKQVVAVRSTFGFISVLRLTAVLKLLSLPFHSGPFKRIYYSELYSLARPLLFEYFPCS